MGSSLPRASLRSGKRCPNSRPRRKAAGFRGGKVTKKRKNRDKSGREPVFADAYEIRCSSSARTTRLLNPTLYSPSRLPFSSDPKADRRISEPAKQEPQRGCNASLGVRPLLVPVIHAFSACAKSRS
jgi:hypothetical protein